MLVKLVSILVLFVETTFFGYLPYIWVGFGHHPRVRDVVACFAGGVFLAIAFVSILPQANLALASIIRGESSHSHQHGQQGKHQHPLQWGSLIAILTFIAVLTFESYIRHRYHPSHHTHKTQNQHQGIELQQELAPHSHEHIKGHALTSKSSSVVLTQFAFSLISVIECLALGSQANPRVAFLLLIAIVCHKWVEALILGFEYKKAGFTPQLALNFSLFHGCLNALGVVLGWVLVSSNPLITGILGGVCTGIFMYIGTIQKMQEQFSHLDNLGQKLFCTLAGIAFVCLII